MCVQRKLRSACASAQSDHFLFSPRRNFASLTIQTAVILIWLANAQADQNIWWAHTFFFFFFFFFFFDLGFTVLSIIFHLYRVDRSSKVGENWRTRGRNHLTIRKQNLAFQHVTRARLELQRWETWWIKSQLYYPLGYGGPHSSYNGKLSRKHAYIILITLNPAGIYKGIHYFFLFLLENIESMFWAEIWKYQNFLSENYHFFFFGGKSFQYIWIGM